MLVCLLYFFNQIFKSCNPSWPLPFDLALSHTARPSRAVARRVLILGHDGRHQASARSSCPGVVLTPLPRRHACEEGAVGSCSRALAMESFSAMRARCTCSVCGEEIWSGLKLSDVGPMR